MEQRAPRDSVSGSDRNDHEQPKKSHVSFWFRLPVIIGSTLVFAALFFIGLRYFAQTLTHESTDDAFLDGQIISIAPKVAGQVTSVLVNNNQIVKSGQLLLELDPRDLTVQVQEKKASVESSEANVALLYSGLSLLRAQIQTAQASAKQAASEANAARASAEKAGADLRRSQELFQNKTISAQEFDATKAAAQTAEANFKAAEDKSASENSKVAQAQAQLEAGGKAYERGKAQTRQAQLEMRAAELNLSYARIHAPEYGQVTRKSVENGDYLQIGQRVMSLVTTQLWVTANFKETQLKSIRPGQRVSVKVDSLNHKTFPAHVDSIQAGSGSRFSLLPPENAVGNYVKVVQRVPVRILFDGVVQSEHVLGPGMSVSPSVRVKSYEIPALLLFLIAAVLALVAGAIWLLYARRSKTRE